MTNNQRTILAPSTNHEQIIKEALDNQKAILGISILPFSAYLNQFSHDTDDAITKFSLAYQAIQHIKSECSIIGFSLHYPEIVQQFVSFTMDCIQYEINADDLQQETPKQQDIARILSTIRPIYENTVTLSTIKHAVSDASSLMIHPFNQTLYESKIIEYLCDKGAQRVNPTLYEQPDATVHFALNHAKEAEAIAQHLLKKDEQSTLIVCCETTVLPTLLQSALDRANIQSSSDIANPAPLLVSQFLSLFALLEHQQMDDLMDCIHNQVFPLDDTTSLLQYLTLYEITFNDLFKPFTYYHNQDWVILDQRDLKQLVLLESKAENARKSLATVLQPLLNNPLYACFNYFAEMFPSMDLEQQQVFLSLKNIIENLLRLNMSDETIEVLLPYFAQSVAVTTPKQKHTVHITSLQQSYQPGFDQVIIVGANQSHYPGFSKINGIIDEQYVLTTTYPRLEQRLNHHLEQLAHIIHLAPSIIISYATSTFEGKPLEPAYDLVEQVNTKATPWHLVFYHTNYKPTYKLSPDISQSLFFNNNRIRGSVSSMEVFFQCQYRYFLKSGLKLSDNNPQPTLVALIGSISHAIVEKLIQLDPKEYGAIPYSDLLNEVEHYFLDLHTLYPHQRSYWQFIAQRLSAQLSLALKRLHAQEASTDFTFYEAEKRFETTWELQNGTFLDLLGFVDRIDTTDDFFRIIDYKSSQKNLSYALVKSGQQLQLLTYLLVVKDLLKQQPSGAFYYSFLNQNISVSSYKLSNNKITPLSYADFIEEFYKQHKLSGWFVSDQASMYNDDWHIKHITKKGAIKKTGLFDLNKIHKLLLKLYTHLSDELQLGNIDRNPIEEACKYCDFKHICIFKDKFNQAIDYDLDNDLKQGEAK